MSVPILALLLDATASFHTTRTHATTAIEAGMGVCVEPSMLPAVPQGAQDTSVATFAGFPTGKHHPLIKATEARFAVQQGATMVALVPDLALAREETTTGLISEAVAVREAIPHPAQMAVVLETTVLTTAELQRAARALEGVGVDALLTGTTRSDASKTAALVAATSLPVIAVCANEQAPNLVEAGASQLWVSGLV